MWVDKQILISQTGCIDRNTNDPVLCRLVDDEWQNYVPPGRKTMWESETEICLFYIIISNKRLEPKLLKSYY